MPARSPNLSRAVAGALKDAQFLTRDHGTVALAMRYAELIEDAVAVAARLDDMEPDDASQARVIAALRARVEAHQVASDLGPKLLAALSALGMNPQARAGTTKGGTPDAGSPAGDALAALRARHAAAAG